ncbi:MAG: helicase-related protein, partial [Trebonia sp.]
LLAEVVKELLLEGFNPIVFCRFIDTAEYVAEHLAHRLGSGYAVAAVTGVLPPDEREARIRELTADQARRPVLIATDCLSEGVNLQESFQAVVHYDLAWNPTRHEQREGRVDRFGQRASTVRAVTLYGTDNGIDGIVLDVLLRKHEQIRRALGISVPVPDRSDDVVQAILEGLLLRQDPGEQLAFEGFGAEKRTELHRDWDSAVARERQSRTKYAQAGIQPAEVARELAEVRATLGTQAELAEFTSEALRALHADVTSIHNKLRAGTAALPAGLRDALVTGHAEPLTFHRDLPVPPRESYLDRTDPNVAAIARYVLESALDSVTPADPRDRPARRCGVMVTDAVPARTTLLLVRYRFHLELPGRDGPRQLVAEDAQLLAYRGRPASAQWLSPDEVAALLAVAPSGNIPLDEALDFTERAVAALDALRPHLDAVADSLAVKLRDDHIRVREAGGQRVRRQIAVRAQQPADLLGVYVYLPGNPASPAQGGGA